MRCRFSVVPRSDHSVVLLIESAGGSMFLTDPMTQAEARNFQVELGVALGAATAKIAGAGPPSSN